MHTQSIPFPSTPSVSITWPIDRLRRKARRFAVRLAKFVVFCADYYSATVQYEELAKLSHVELERRGIARGDLHRHVGEALPRWQSHQ
jgi:hypothetical protein